MRKHQLQHRRSSSSNTWKYRYIFCFDRVYSFRIRPKWGHKLFTRDTCWHHSTRNKHYDFVFHTSAVLAIDISTPFMENADYDNRTLFPPTPSGKGNADTRTWRHFEFKLTYGFPNFIYDANPLQKNELIVRLRKLSKSVILRSSIFLLIILLVRKL